MGVSGGTHCQSVCMWARCRSLERKATWHVLQVKGWVDCTEGEGEGAGAAWVAMVVRCAEWAARWEREAQSGSGFGML